MHMKKFLIIFLLSSGLFAQDIWVIGKTYLLHHENEKTHTLNKTPNSSAYDKANCRLWVTDQNQLYSIERNKRTLRGNAEAILSEINDTFLTLGTNGKVELRDSEGEVLKSFPAPWSTRPTTIVHIKDFTFALIESGDNNLSLQIYDQDFNVVRETVVARNRFLWNIPKLLVDEKKELVWIAYTVSQPWALYAPVLEKRTFKGDLLSSEQWKERGVLFDACLEENGNVLLSRDISSQSPYSVPIHSYLEKISSQVETVFSHEENQFIDSLSCQNNEIAFISRSFFGSDGSTIRIWDKTHKEMSKTLFKLPDPAWKIYSCPVQ